MSTSADGPMSTSGGPMRNSPGGPMSSSARGPMVDAEDVQRRLDEIDYLVDEGWRPHCSSR